MKQIFEKVRYAAVVMRTNRYAYILGIALLLAVLFFSGGC